ncbi:hypothetical protein HMI55_002223 [Coelomomyces lativittatus]|nr:hypothetical protein HMI55_002223 [Coelomomyces lativittatus]
MSSNTVTPSSSMSSSFLSENNKFGDICVAFSNSIPIFSGIGGSTPTTLHEFIKTVEMNLEFSGLNEVDALFWIVSRLGGPAKSWLQANFVGEKALRKLKSWNDLKEVLQEKYKEPHAEVKHAMELAGLKQGTLTVAEYTVKFNKATEHFPDLPEKFKVGLYVAHLCENVASYVKSNPTNLSTLTEVQSAALLQNKIVQNNTQIANRFNSNFKSNNFKKKKDFKNFSKPINTEVSKKFNMDDVECRRCNKKGHYARECQTEVKDLPSFSKSE